MSIINQYKEQNQITNQENNKNQITINMPVMITGYENEFFLGTRLDKKEQVRVKFRDVEIKSDNPKSKRPEVADFQAKGGKRYCEPNKSIILFDNTYKEEDGTFNSRWANTLCNQKIDSKVLILNSTVGFFNKNNNAGVYINSLKKQTPVANIEQLNEALLEALTAKTNKARNSAIIRMVDSNGGVQVVYVSASMIKIVDGDIEYKVMDTPENSLKFFYEGNKYSKLVTELIGNPEVTTDVFHQGTIYTGADTSQKIYAKDFNSLKEAYKISEDESKNGYKKTVLALRTRADGSVYCTFVKPLINNTNAQSIERVKF